MPRQHILEPPSSPGVGTVARKQSERTENNALARSRLTRNHGETPIETNIEIVYQDKVLYE